MKNWNETSGDEKHNSWWQWKRTKYMKHKLMLWIVELLTLFHNSTAMHIGINGVCACWFTQMFANIWFSFSSLTTHKHTTHTYRIYIEIFGWHSAFFWQPERDGKKRKKSNSATFHKFGIRLNVIEKRRVKNAKVQFCLNWLELTWIGAMGMQLIA